MKKYYLPAEWEKQEGVQLTWPHEDTDWNEYLDEVNNVYLQMADAITRYETLFVVTPHIDKVKKLLCKHLSVEQIDRVVFHECPTNDTWARDHGFISLKRADSMESHKDDIKETCKLNSDNDKDRLLLDFQFNGWGEKFEADLDTKINNSLFKSGVVKGDYIDLNNFVLEGGSIESDGKGSIFTTSCCLLAPHRNQPLSKAEIEDKLKEYLHADRIVWIDHGELIGDDTDGHIDTLVRTAPDDTLLYVGCDDISDEQYTKLKLMEEQLNTFLTTDGRHYRLLKLPMPDAIFYDGERLPATYANFIVINGAVILPTYQQPEKDSEARRIVQQAFPDREIICIDSSVIVRQHGSLHCCSMQFPA